MPSYVPTKAYFDNNDNNNDDDDDDDDDDDWQGPQKIGKKKT